MKAASSLVLVLFVLTATAQTQFSMACDKGYCVISESDVDRLQSAINALIVRLQDLIEENASLKERSGCS